MSKYFSFLFSLFPYSSFAFPQFQIRWNSDEEEKRKKKKRKKKRERKKKRREIVCSRHPSWLMVCGDYYFLFYSPFPRIVYTNTNTTNTNHNTNTGGCVDWWVTINHKRVVAAALLRDKGKKKRGDQQEGGVALCCQKWLLI